MVDYLRRLRNNQILEEPIYGSSIITIVLAIICIPYWWLTIKWSYTILFSPDAIFAFFTTTFLLLLVILDSIFLIRYYQLKSKQELRKKKEELAKSEELYRSIIKASPDGIAISDNQGRLGILSPSAVTMLGGSSEDEFIGKTVFDMIHPDDVPQIKEKLSMLLSGHKQNAYQLRSKRKDGSIFPNEINSDVIRDQKGNPTELVTIFRDITERENIMAQVKENEELFHSIFQDMSDPLLILDEKGIILDINKIGEDELHLYKDKNHGLDIISCNLFIEENNDQVKSFILNSKNGEELETYINYPQETTRFVLLKVTTIKIKGNNAILLLIHDIDEIKRVQNALSQANQKINLLNNITRHDIINKVMIVNAYCGFLKEKITDERLQEKLNIIFNSGDNIRQLIDFTNEYQGLGGKEPVWQNINKLFEKRVIKSLLNNITLTLPEDNIEIFADTMLEKVIYNLIENSIRHGERVTTIRISYKEERGKLLLFYSDDGVGISDKEKPKLFKKGYGKNTGLGLFLICEILGITNITIEEKGKMGEGVLFVMTVPPGDFRINRAD